MAHRIISTGLMVATLTLTSLLAYSQSASTEQIQPVDQRVEDVSQLAGSLRRVERGLCDTNCFDQLFRMPGDDGRFMRVQGGLYAVFPQSAYSQSGDIAVIPANTTFYIGPPPGATVDEELPPPPPSWLGMRILPQAMEAESDEACSLLQIAPLEPIGRNAAVLRELEEKRRLRKQVPVVHSVEIADGPSVFNDSEFRASRVRELLIEAVEAPHAVASAEDT